MERSSWLVLILSLSVAAAAPASADQWEKTFPLSGRPDLNLVTDDGSVRVGTWERKAVGIKVTTKSLRIGTTVRVEQQQDGNRIDVRVLKHRPWPISVELSMSSRPIQVQVWLPRQAILRVTSGDGSLNVSPLAGRITLRTGDGSIRADGLKGDINLSSGDGSITALDLDGNLKAQTGDGAVRIEGRFDALELGSGDGSVKLKIRANLDAELDARTGDGRIHMDLPVRVTGRITDRSIHGDLNKGGPPLRIRTGDGPVRIGAL